MIHLAYEQTAVLDVAKLSIFPLRRLIFRMTGSRTIPAQVLEVKKSTLLAKKATSALPHNDSTLGSSAHPSGSFSVLATVNPYATPSVTTINYAHSVMRFHITPPPWAAMSEQHPALEVYRTTLATSEANDRILTQVHSCVINWHCHPFGKMIPMKFTIFAKIPPCVDAIQHQTLPVLL